MGGVAFMRRENRLWGGLGLGKTGTDLRTNGTGARRQREAACAPRRIRANAEPVPFAHEQWVGFQEGRGPGVGISISPHTCSA